METTARGADMGLAVVGPAGVLLLVLWLLVMRLMAVKRAVMGRFVATAEHASQRRKV